MGAGTWGPGENERGFVVRGCNSLDDQPESMICTALEDAGFNKVEHRLEFYPGLTYSNLIDVEVGGWEDYMFLRIKARDENNHTSDYPSDTLREVGSLPAAYREAVDSAMQATERYLANALTMAGFECCFKAGSYSYSAPCVLDEGFEWDAAAARLKAMDTVPELKDQIARAGMDPLSEDRSHLLKCIAEEHLSAHQTSMVALLPVLWDEQIRFLPLGFNSPIQNLGEEAMLVTLTRDDPILEGYAQDAVTEFSGRDDYDPAKPVILGDQWRNILQQHVVSPSVMNFDHPNAVYAIIPTEEETKQYWGDLENPLLPSLDDQNCFPIRLDNPTNLNYAQRRDLAEKGRVAIEGLTYETELPLDVVMDSPEQAVQTASVQRDDLSL
ncbi:MAG: hypothetical protein IBX50_08510 [Marinospirillum sp.]|uniref:hypothetical protein n=1 Tax=Marinospirillum sp. TaxID=2183934 RepID=UPI001A10A89A|nr:hypothetical protein [Marinospirillum sp.]MBE0506748.1 hypothetical protein [Marinospirillum sp.]